MKLVSFDDNRVGLLDQRGVVDITDVLPGVRPGAGCSPMRALIEDFAGLRQAVDSAAAARDPIDLARVTLHAPLCDPTKILAAPINYTDHMVEMQSAAYVGRLGFFLKAPSSLLDPGGVVQLPYSDRRFDQEGELAVVIGRRAKNVPEASALGVVFGYTGLLDITMRGGEDRSTRKSFDTFTPLGPCIVTRDECPNPDELDLTCRVNNAVRQHANTKSLIWSVAKLVSYCSSVTTLLPGDIITTGTPAGVGPIGDGDTIELELGAIGTLRVSVANEHAATCPTGGERPVEGPRGKGAR